MAVLRLEYFFIILVLIFSPLSIAQDNDKEKESICWPLGNRKVFDHAGQVTSARFSRDGTKVVSISDDGIAHVFKLKSGEEKTIKQSFFINDADFSPNGESLLLSGDNGTVAIVSITSGKIEKSYPGPSPVTGAQYSTDGKKILVTYYNGLVDAVDLATQKIERAIRHSDTVSSAGFSPTAGAFVTASRDGRARYIEVSTGEEKVAEDAGWVKGAQFSPDGRKIVTTTDKSIKIWELARNEMKEVRGIKPLIPAHFSPDGKSLVTASQDGIVKIIELATGHERVVVHLNGVTSAYFSPEGRRLLTTNGRFAQVMDLDQECKSQPANTILPEKIEKVTQVPFIFSKPCLVDFNPLSWDFITPVENGTLQRSQVEGYLRRFGKPSGFDPKKHLNILLGILQSQYGDGDSQLVYPALVGVLNSSNLLYESLFEHFPKLKSLGPVDSSCITSNEKAAFRKTVFNYTSEILRLIPSFAKYSDFQLLEPLKGQFLADNEKLAFARLVAEKLAARAAETEELKLVPFGKLTKMAMEKANGLFGLPIQQESDIAVIRDNQQIKLVGLGTKSLGEESVLSEGGFYYKTGTSLFVDFLPYMKIKKEQMNWSHEGKNYLAEVNLTRKLTLSHLVPEEKTFRYNEMLSDHVLHGLVVVGSDSAVLQYGENAKAVFQEYKDYFSGVGFTFQNPKPVPHVKSFVKRRFSEGEVVDYFIKESRSDGDERNAFKLNKTGQVYRGVRKSKEGKEIIELVYMSENQKSNDEQLVSDADLGRWMATREKAKLGPLVYISSGYWSYTKTVHELTIAASGILSIIPTFTRMEGFRNNPQNVTHELIEGLRVRENFVTIRKRMEKNVGYKAREENVYLFPDEIDFDNQIRKALVKPVNEAVKLTEITPKASGRSVSSVMPKKDKINLRVVSEVTKGVASDAPKDALKDQKEVSPKN